MIVTSLINAAQLHERLADPSLRILDIQWNLVGASGLDLYRAAHIPGARHLDLDAHLASAPGADGRHPLPDTDRLQEVLRDCGISDSSSIVVYDQQTSLAAARAWWILRWCGIPSVSVLNGGLKAWQDAGYLISSEAAATSPRGTVTLRPGARPYLTTDAAAQCAHEGRLYDAREAERFVGKTEPIDPVAGHIPGARNAPMSGYLTSAGTFADPAELRAHFDRLGIASGDTVGTSCGSGVTACHLALALDQIGVSAEPYIGSWSNWVADPSRPVATGPEDRTAQ